MKKGELHQKMNRIVGIIDMNGFQIGKILL